MSTLDCVAITSEHQERQFIAALEKRRLEYALIYKLITETGIPFSYLTELKVKELSGKNSLSYASRAGTPRDMPISIELQNEVSEFLNDKAPDELAFSSRNGKNPLHPATFNQALYSASKECSITPPVTLMSLRKTFLYKLILRDGNLNRVRSFTLYNSTADIYHYIGIEPPEKSGRKNDIPDARASLIKDNTLDSISSKTDAAFYRIDKAIDRKDFSNETYIEINRFLNDMDSVLSRYRGLISTLSNPDEQNQAHKPQS